MDLHTFCSAGKKMKNAVKTVLYGSLRAQTHPSQYRQSLDPIRPTETSSLNAMIHLLARDILVDHVTLRNPRSANSTNNGATVHTLFFSRP